MIYDPPVKPRGPKDARILIVGEAPGEHEIRGGAPFLGPSGHELDKLLTEAGIDPQLCRITNVVGYRPDRNNISLFFSSSKKKAGAEGATLYRNRYAKDILLFGVNALKEEIARVKPNVVIAIGNTALWATTGQWGITSWRGSQMMGNIDDVKFKVVPIVHPAAILRQHSYRWHTVVDLRRAAFESESPDLVLPKWDFLLRPSYTDVLAHLGDLLRRADVGRIPLAVDIETRARHIACVGIADSSLRAICIPFMCVENDAGYWTLREEQEIWWILYLLLTHPNAHIIGQNFLYDNQYFIRRAGFAANLQDDTMMKMHTIFPGVRKGLDFISSIFCNYHCYWKDEGKTWNKTMNEDQLWVYNCRDAVATFEANFAMDISLETFSLQKQYRERMRVSQKVALPMMLRGVAASTTQKKALLNDCNLAIQQRRDFLLDILQGFDLFGPKGISSKQMFRLCYDILQLPPQYRKDPKTKQNRLSCDKDAIEEWLLSCNIFYRPILKVIKDIRSLAVFRSNFASAPLDWDERFRCSFNVAGPHTFRWSASKDAFDYGTNLQTIPKGDER